MPRLLLLTDFRARRRVLTRRDFGYAPNRAPRLSDLIDKATWDSIVTLPDDVAVRTTNYHGTTVKQLDELWGAWIERVGLRGLGEDKLRAIRSYAKFFAGTDPA